AIPPTVTPAPTLTPTPEISPAGAGRGACVDFVHNGSFETLDEWQFGKTKLRGGYSGLYAQTGQRSVWLGNINALSQNIKSYSSIRQRVQLPASPHTTATLSFWYYPISDREPGDYQEFIVLDGNTVNVIKRLWRVNRNDHAWVQQRIDLTPYLGRAIYLYFNVYNNGGTGRAAMYLDTVSLTLCGPERAAATPAPIANATQPPAPTAPAPTATATAGVTPTATNIPVIPSQTPLPTQSFNNVQPLPPTPTPITTSADKAAAQKKKTNLRIFLYLLIPIVLIILIAIAIWLYKVMKREKAKRDSPIIR
ncbi:MAG: hypothetical protein DSY55_01125, partial [Clostridia bacterium]